MWQLPQNLLGLLLLSVLKWEGATRVCDPREHFREPTKKGGDRHSNRLPTFVIFSIFPCGEIGIRTRDTILSYTRFPGALSYIAIYYKLNIYKTIYFLMQVFCRF